MATIPQFITAVYTANTAAESDFGGLGKGGLITVILVSVLLLVVFIWLVNGTKKRD